MVALLDVVTLSRDVPKDGLRRGGRGTVVEAFRLPREAYEVEGADSDGRTTAPVTLACSDIEVVRPRVPGPETSELSKPDAPVKQVV